MKVAVYAPNLAPTIGGGYTFQASLIEPLIALAEKSGHQFIIYSQIGKSPSDSIEYVQMNYGYLKKLCYRLSEGLNYFQDRYLNKRLIHFMGWFERDVKKRSVDFVWYLTPEYLEADLPYLYTIWDVQHMSQPWFPELTAKGEWERRQNFFAKVIQKASMVIVPNPAGKNQLLRYYPIDAERVICLAHPTPEFNINLSESECDSIVNGLGVRRPFLFYPAQFWAHKNHVSLLHALKILKSKNHIYDLVFSGSDKGNRKYIETQAHLLGIENQVKFLGFIPIETLVALYKKAFALTYVSYCGPENLPPLEAFSLSCPVIATSVEGASDELGDAYLPVDLASAASLESQIASQVLRLETESGLRSLMIEKGLKQSKRFSGPQYIDGTLKYLNRFNMISRSWGKLQ